MEDSREGAPADDSVQSHGRSRRRPVNACSTCRARKVKCDERPNGCLNCERLQLTCVQHPTNGAVAPQDQTDGSRAITGIKRKRTFRVCVPCRQSKIKCSGERPVCSRCRQRSATCAYDAEVAEPAWVHNIVPPPTSSHTSPQNVTASSASPTPPWNSHAQPVAVPLAANCPPALTWLFAPSLPPKAKLRNLLEAYFDNVHPLRVFAFVHRPSFMRMLEEGLLTERSDQALLYIMCALGAQFFALEYSESTASLPQELIQRAGSQWAKIAEETFFSDYSNISVTKLKVLVLLHDHEARMGNYAASFLLTGMIIRMAHALQINQESSSDILCKETGVSNEVSLRESRRRLMWACYVVDVWAGSGVDQLTILNERDIKLQLPCNERQFLLQIATVTERLQPGMVLDFIAAEDIPERPRDNMGMSAYYVRIIYIWQRVLRYIKHIDEVQQPWAPGAEFARLLEEIAAWKASHPQWLAFSSDNIYIRRASSQLGALFLVHCMYHHVLCDLHRISLPNLFKIREPFVFPPEQFRFMASLQATCFENAQQVSILTSTTLQHGVKYLADAIVPSLVYNSSRIMLYYTARILDRTKPDAPMIIQRTIELIQQNNRALREMSQLFPLAEPLYITTEEWLEKVRESIARGQALQYIAPPDPSAPNGGEVAQPRITSPTTETEIPPDQPLPAMPAFASPHLSNPSSHSNPNSLLNPTTSPVSTFNTFNSSDNFAYTVASAPASVQPNPQSILIPMPPEPTPPQVDQMGPVYYPGMENLEQPIFDLNDLQNFFEWENAEAEPPPTGVEGLGPLGWNGLSNV